MLNLLFKFIKPDHLFISINNLAIVFFRLKSQFKICISIFIVNLISIDKMTPRELWNKAGE